MVIVKAVKTNEDYTLLKLPDKNLILVSNKILGEIQKGDLLDIKVEVVNRFSTVMEEINPTHCQ